MSCPTTFLPEICHSAVKGVYLPEEARNLFLRRYWFFDPIAAIARRYGLTQSKVKTTLFRTRQRLRDHLIKEGFTV